MSLSKRWGDKESWRRQLSGTIFTAPLFAEAASRCCNACGAILQTEKMSLPFQKFNPSSELSESIAQPLKIDPLLNKDQSIIKPLKIKPLKTSTTI